MCTQASQTFHTSIYMDARAPAARMKQAEQGRIMQRCRLTYAFPDRQVGVDDILVLEQEDVPHIDVVGGHIDAVEPGVAFTGAQKRLASDEAKGVRPIAWVLDQHALLEGPRALAVRVDGCRHLLGGGVYVLDEGQALDDPLAQGDEGLPDPGGAEDTCSRGGRVSSASTVCAFASSACRIIVCCSSRHWAMQARCS